MEGGIIEHFGSQAKSAFVTVDEEKMKETMQFYIRCQSYKTFYVRNLQIFVVS
jgi:hypothetical protein